MENGQYDPVNLSKKTLGLITNGLDNVSTTDIAKLPRDMEVIPMMGIMDVDASKVADLAVDGKIPLSSLKNVIGEVIADKIKSRGASQNKTMAKYHNTNGDIVYGALENILAHITRDWDASEQKTKMREYKQVPAIRKLFESKGESWHKAFPLDAAPGKKKSKDRDAAAYKNAGI